MSFTRKARAKAVQGGVSYEEISHAIDACLLCGDCEHAAHPQAPAPASPHPPQAAPPSSDAIPVTEIAAQAATTTALLRELASRFAPSAEIEAIQRALPEARKLIELESEGTAQMLRGQPSLAAIAKQQELWTARQLQTDRWLNALTRRTTDLQAETGRLTDLQARWRRAQAAAQAAKAPAPVLQQVADLLAGLAAAQAQLQAELTVALDLQSRVAQEAARCSAVLAQIVRAQGQAMGGLLVRDGRAIWSAEGWAEGRAVVRGRARDALASRWDALVQYARDPFQGWPLHVGSFLILAGIFYAARRREPAWTAAGQPVSSAAAALAHPYSAALIVPLVLASGFTSAIPPTLRQLFEVCALVPAIRLARPMLDLRVAPWLYTLGLLFLVDVTRQNLAGVPGFEQEHPHILQLFDSGEADSHLYYVMPYVEGGSLRERLNREKQLSIEEALRTTKVVASALDFAHKRGIVHRDIKPENILLQDGVALIADFGIAVALNTVGGDRLTATGVSMTLKIRSDTHGGLQNVELLGEIADRPEEALRVLDERHERAERERPAGHPRAAPPEDQGGGQRADDLDPTAQREEYDPGKVDVAVRDAIRKPVGHWIDMLGSAGKA